MATDVAAQAPRPRPVPARMTRHDEIAVPLVEAVFGRHGLTGHLLGTESDPAALQAALRHQTDRTSLMIRFRPDRVLVRTGVRSVYCEIKHEEGAYPNFAVEVDSYRAALDHDAAHTCVILALVDLGTRTVWCCWVKDVPRPTAIFVPRRWDFGANWQRMGRGWPGARLVAIAPRKGSGTPFFLVPKGAPFLVMADEFIARELVGRGAATEGAR